MFLNEKGINLIKIKMIKINLIPGKKEKHNNGINQNNRKQLTF